MFVTVLEDAESHGRTVLFLFVTNPAVYSQKNFLQLFFFKLKS